ncbi:MAG: hypothetical protein JXR64_10690 [Spirochaetales bacterium]|nr:hypothetical protein [Spirochaetales bacterium]
MVLFSKIKEIYTDASKDVQYKVNALLAVNIGLIIGTLFIILMYVLDNRYSNIPMVVVLQICLVLSVYFLFKKKYEVSAFIVPTISYIFLLYASFVTVDTSPLLLYKVALYLVAPAMMSSLFTKRVSTMHIFSGLTLLGVILILFIKVIPGNPDLTFIKIATEYLLFVIVLLFFIAFFAIRKHRIAERIQIESNTLYKETQEKALHIQDLLNEVQKSMEITSDLLNDVDKIQGKIITSNDRLERIHNEMDHFKSNFSNSFNQLSVIGDQIAGLNNIVHSQSSAQEESAAATNELVASINNVAQIVDKKVVSARTLIQTTDNGGKKLEDTVNIIQSISSRVGSIMEMVKIINGIASRTNLLSMNAAIEAAHAGDSGRGFAVVAEEIRKLAEVSATNASSIAQVLKEVVGHITQSYEYGLSTKEAYKEITSDVKETSNAFHEISLSTNELNAGTKEILIALTELTGLTKDVRGGADVITESQEAIQEHLSTTGKSIDGILSEIDRIVNDNKDIENSIISINTVVENLKKLNEELSQR